MRRMMFILGLLGLVLMAPASFVFAEEADEDYRLEGLSTWPGGHGSGSHGGGSHGGGSTGGSADHPSDGNCSHSLASAVVQPGAANRAGRYDSIARAVCAVAANGTVYIHPGVYAEHFNIYRGVTLWGIDHSAGGLAQPVVEGPANAGCINIYASGDVTIRNMGIHGTSCLNAEGGALTLDHVTIAGDGGGVGVRVRNSATTIVDSEIRNHRDGIVVTYGSAPGTIFSLRNSRVLYNTTGLVVEAGATFEISDSMFFRNLQFGIYLLSGEGQIRGNRIYRSETGLFLLEREPILVSGNIIAGNPVGAFAPFSLDGDIYVYNEFDCNGVDYRDDDYYGDYDVGDYETPLCAALYEF